MRELTRWTNSHKRVRVLVEDDKGVLRLRERTGMQRSFVTLTVCVGKRPNGTPEYSDRIPSVGWARDYNAATGWWEREPKFRRVASGDYETECGTYELRKLDGGSTAAWNVELSIAAIEHIRDRDEVYAVDDLVVDGAATKAVALKLFGWWWREQQRNVQHEWAILQASIEEGARA